MLKGYDTSVWQSSIDNALVSGDFVLVQTTHGANGVNPDLYRQISTAKKGHKLLGLYHYAETSSWRTEANHFLRIAKPYLKNAVLALDFEGATISVDGISWAKNFLDYVYQKTKTKPLIYMGLADENAHNWHSISRKYGLWIAQYNDMKPHWGYKSRALYGKLRYWSKMTIFQYSATGRLNGYANDLDLDSYYGSKNDWYKHSKNETDGDIEMTWHVKTPVNAVGGFLVTKKSGATLWSDSNDSKQTGHIKYGTNWIVTDVKNGFLKLGKSQWVDSRTGVMKYNPLHFNSKMHAIVEVTGKAAGHAEANGPVTGHDFKIGDTYKCHELKDNYVLIGSGKNKWGNANKFKVIL